MLVHSIFYDGREVITLTGFTALVGKPYNSLEYYKKSGADFPQIVTIEGVHQYYYLDQLIWWYQKLITEKQQKVETLAEALAKVRSNSHLIRDTSKATRQALLDSLKK